MRALAFADARHKDVARTRAMRLFSDRLRFGGTIVEIRCLDEQSSTMALHDGASLLAAFTSLPNGATRRLIVHSFGERAA